VCGLEPLGLGVVTSLQRLGERVTVIARDPDPVLAAEARRSGARILEGGSRDLLGLPRLDLGRARCLVLTDDDDPGNLHAALAVREAHADLRIVMRMFNPGFGGHLARSITNAKTISSSQCAAPSFVGAALTGKAPAADPPVTGETAPADDDDEAEEFGPRPLWQRIAYLTRALRAFLDRRLALIAGSIAILLALTTVLFHRVLGLHWADGLYLAAASSTGNFASNGEPGWLEVYDVAFMFATTAILSMLYALVIEAVVGTRILEALGIPHGRMRGHVIVIGLGSVGYRISQHLRRAGSRVTAAELRESSRWIQISRHQGVPVLIADGTLRATLRALRADRAVAIIAATDDDLANLEAARLARILNPGIHTVARIADADLAVRAVKMLDVDVCLSIAELASPVFASAALGDDVIRVTERNGVPTVVAAWQIEPGSRMDGVEGSALGEWGLVLLGFNGHIGEATPPPAALAAGDRVVVGAPRDAWVRYAQEEQKRGRDQLRR
jgi:Trk K+ transport system NAD-binding subunit